jgi:hypothetical protein
MKRKKILKRLEKVETILSQIVAPCAACEPGTQKLLEGATEAVVRARTAVAKKASSPQKNISSQVPGSQPSVAEADEQKSLVPAKKRVAVKRKGVQSETTPTAVDNTGPSSSRTA